MTSLIAQSTANQNISALLLGLAGLVVGALITFLIAHLRQSKTNAQLAAASGRATTAETKLSEQIEATKQAEREAQNWQHQVIELKTTLDHEKRTAREKEQLLERAETKLSDTFKALSAEALRKSNEQFLQTAKQSLAVRDQESARDLDKRRSEIEKLVKPVADSLKRFETHVDQIEKARHGAYKELRSQVEAMAKTQSGLQHETAQLVKALRQPTGRGQWGELQLKRVVELAGMQEYCDFDLQTSVTQADGQRSRPDMIVRLPGGKSVIVDAKTPMDAYLEALEATDDVTRHTALKRHARQVLTHITQLSGKRYTEQFDNTPEFTVLFLPSESIFSAALETDPGLIEKGVENNVILATPTTLIALLRAVAYGWRQEALAANAREISKLGRTLHQRLGTLNDHFSKLGNALQSAVGHFNRAIGSFESRVLSTARQFESLQAADPDTLPAPKPVETLTREVAEPASDDLLTHEPDNSSSDPNEKTKSAADDLRSALDEESSI